jgi:hypothetical protein
MIWRGSVTMVPTVYLETLDARPGCGAAATLLSLGAGLARGLLGWLPVLGHRLVLLSAVSLRACPRKRATTPCSPWHTASGKSAVPRERTYPFPGRIRGPFYFERLAAVLTNVRFGPHGGLSGSSPAFPHGGVAPRAAVSARKRTRC